MQPRVIGYKRQSGPASGMDVSRPRFGRPQVIGTRLLAFFVLCGAFASAGRAAPHPQIPIWNARASKKRAPRRCRARGPRSPSWRSCLSRRRPARVPRVGSPADPGRGHAGAGRGAHQHVPDAATRTAGEACLLKMTEFSTELLQNEAIYARFQRTAPPTVSTASSSRTWVEAFEDTGVALPRRSARA